MAGTLCVRWQASRHLVQSPASRHFFGSMTMAHRVPAGVGAGSWGGCTANASSAVLPVRPSAERPAVPRNARLLMLMCHSLSSGAGATWQSQQYGVTPAYVWHRSQNSALFAWHRRQVPVRLFV